jgi:hypothetical protein
LSLCGVWCLMVVDLWLVLLCESISIFLGLRVFG